jgi:hypothetical protein
MPTIQSEDDRKRPDPNDPRTGAAGGDSQPNEADANGDSADRDADEVETDGKELGG